MENKVTRIFFAENIPSLNKGEMTILEGMIESFKILGDVNISVISDLPDIDRLRYKSSIDIIDIRRYLPFLSSLNNRNRITKLIDALPILSLHVIFMLLYKVFGKRSLKIMKAEIWRKIAEADIIMLGHDGSFGFGGSTGTPIFLYPVFIPFFARKIKKPVVFYGGSLFRLDNLPFPLRYLFKASLNNIDLITLREEKSYQYVKAIQISEKKAMLTADPACLLQPLPEVYVKEIMKKEGLEGIPRPLIGFTLKSSIAFKAFRRKLRTENYDSHVKYISKLIDELILSLNANIVFVPHCIGYGSYWDDRIICKHVLEHCQNKNNVKLISSEYNADELKGLIGQFDFFIGERLHSVINALTMYVPSVTIALSSDERVEIIKMIGQEKSISYIDQISENMLFKEILNIWQERKKIQSELHVQIPLFQEQARQNGRLLLDLLSSVATK